MYSRTRAAASAPYILICLLSLWVIHPLLRPGFFRAHDAFIQIYHMIEVNACLSCGMLYPRWFPDIYWGYGGPFMTFYPPLFYYAVLPFYWLTQSYFAGFKIAIGMGILLSGLLMYCFAAQCWGRRGGLVAAVAYMYAPYHIVDIYVRGAFQEATLYVMLPLLMLLVRKATCTGKRIWVGLFSLTLGLSFLTHPMSFLLPFIVAAYAILLTGRRRWKRAAPLAIGLVLAVGLSAFYWLPAALQQPYVYLNRQIIPGDYDYRDHFVYPLQLLSTAWGWGDSTRGPEDGMSFQVGAAHIIFFLLSIVALPALRGEQRKATLLFQAMGIVFIFATLSYSAFLWNTLPLLNVLQFPWRLLLFANFFTSFLGGAALRLLDRRRAATGRNAMAAAAILLVVGLYGRYCRALYPNEIFRSEADCTRRTVLERPVWQFDLAYAPIWVTQMPDGIPENKVSLRGPGHIENVGSAPDRISFHYSAERQTGCRVNIFYYPCWECRVDGRPHPVRPADQTGEMVFSLPAGSGRVELTFTNAPSVMTAQITSLVSMAAIVCMMWPRRVWPRPWSGR